VHLQVGLTDFGTAKDLYYYDADSNTDRKYSAAVSKQVTVSPAISHNAPLLLLPLVLLPFLLEVSPLVISSICFAFLCLRCW
jgi:hypothetical protein